MEYIENSYFKDFEKKFKDSFDDILDDTEIKWLYNYTSSVKLLEDFFNIKIPKYDTDYFFCHKDDFIFWNGMKIFCNDVKNAVDIITELKKKTDDLGFSHISLDESGFIYYFRKDPIFLIKDKLGYFISSILMNGLIGDKNGLFACNYDYLKSVLSNTNEKQTTDVIKNIRKTYLMRDNKTGFYKIGYSKNPSYRERTLQSEKPDVTLLFYCDTFLEKELHNKFKNNRVRGEWFDLSADNVLDIYGIMASEPGFKKCTPL